MKRSTWATLLALAPVVVGATALSILGLFAVRASVSPTAFVESNDVVGNYLQTLGGIYAVLLAFVVIVVWQQFNDVRTQVEREANEIADLFRTTQGLPEPQRSGLKTCLLGYVEAVLAQEWTAMAKGDEIVFERVGGTLDDAARILHAYEAGSNCQQALHTEALSRLNDLSDARSMRLTASRLHIPRALRWILYGGAFLLVGSTWIFEVESVVVHAIVTGALAGAVSHVIYVIEDLDNCFKGDWRVPRRSFEAVRSLMQR